MSPPTWTPSDAAAGIVLFGIARFVFLLVLSILWIILPFAVFGIKKRLDRMILLQEEQIEVLRSIRDGLDDPRP